jgi:hypothetical protein
MLSVSVAIVAWGASAFADSPNLKGDYGFIENDWCIYAGDFTAPPTFEALTNGPSESHAVSGTFTFNGDGTGTATQTSLAATRGGGFTGNGGAEASTSSFPFTYTVNGDGTWNLVTILLQTGTFTAGPRTGQTFTITHSPAGLSGQISQNAMMLTLANQTPRVQTLTFQDGTKEFRICTTTRVFIALPKGQ